MTNRVRILAAVSFIAVATSAPAHAQLIGMPVLTSPKGGSGLTIGLLYGRGVNGASGKNTVWAARALLGISAFSIGGAIGTINPQVGTTGRQTEGNYMANAAVRLLGGPLSNFAVNINGGVGYVQFDAGTGDRIRRTNYPVGVGLGLNIPLSGFALEAWASPRASIVRTRGGVTNIDEWQSGFGISAGLNLGVANGLGIQGGFDWTSLPASGILLEAKPALIGFGASYSFNIPGL